MADTVTNPVPAMRPKCRICGHEDYFLADHLAEAHGLDIEGYLKAFPGAPTVAQEVLDILESERPKNARRTGPPADTGLKVKIRDFALSVNPDVPDIACLKMPYMYGFPTHGDLGIDMIEAIIAFVRRRHMYVYGPPGSGKDAFFHAMCNTLRIPSLIRSVNPQVNVGAWLYERSFDKDGTGYDVHELFYALTEGYTCPNTGRKLPYTVLISDFDRATTSQAEFLRLIIDSIGGRVQGPGGSVHDVFPGTQIVATANTAGGGDARGRMVSSNIIDASILDRFERTLQFHWMEWDDEEPICKAKFPLLVERCPDIFPQVGKATGVLRDAIYKEQLYAEFSHRAVCAWLGHAEDIITMTGSVPKDLPLRSARAGFLDAMTDDETRLQAARLIDPHIKKGVIGREPKGVSSDPLGGFGA